MVMMKPLKGGGGGADEAAARDDRMERVAHPDGFSPAGLKVLVVDDDLMCLMILKRMLSQCQYTVTTCNSATKALAMLRENRSYFDLVLSDVYMPDMDGLKLLEAIGLELDLPVIMMSADGKTDVVMKGITHGACDYLLKPVRIEELRNIWQHVVRKRVTPRGDAPREELSGEWGDDAAAPRAPETDAEHSSRKRKEKMEDDNSGGGGSPPVVEDVNSLKKARVVWSPELHKQFVQAVNFLGVDKAVPRRILDIMNVQGLTRENVASHLQKYRLYLKRLIGVTPQPYPVASFQASESGDYGGSMQIQPGGRPASSSTKGVNLGAAAGGPGMPLSGLGGGRGAPQIDAATLTTLAQLQGLQQRQQDGNAQGGHPLSLAATPVAPLGLQRMDSFELDLLMKAQFDAALSRGQGGGDLPYLDNLGAQDELKPMLMSSIHRHGDTMTATSMSNLGVGEELGGLDLARGYDRFGVAGDFSSTSPFSSAATTLSNGGERSFNSYADFSDGGPAGFLAAAASPPDMSLLGQLEAFDQAEGDHGLLPARSLTYS